MENKLIGPEDIGVFVDKAQQLFKDAVEKFSEWFKKNEDTVKPLDPPSPQMVLQLIELLLAIIAKHTEWFNAQKTEIEYLRSVVQTQEETIKAAFKK